MLEISGVQGRTDGAMIGIGKDLADPALRLTTSVHLRPLISPYLASPTIGVRRER